MIEVEINYPLSTDPSLPCRTILNEMTATLVAAAPWGQEFLLFTSQDQTRG
jgi:hypothetical protein